MVVPILSKVAQPPVIRMLNKALRQSANRKCQVLHLKLELQPEWLPERLLVLLLEQLLVVLLGSGLEWLAPEWLVLLLVQQWVLQPVLLRRAAELG